MNDGQAARLRRRLVDPARAATGRAAPSASSAGRRSAGAAAGPRGHRVPARDVVATLGQPLEPAVGDGDPPQLVGAVDRGAEGEPAAVLRGRSSAGLSPRVRSLLIPEPGIRSCAAERFRPPVGVASEPSAANSQMSLRLPAPPSSRCPSAAIVRPSGSHVGADEHRARTARDGGHGPGLDVDDVDVRPVVSEVGVAAPVRREGDPSSVGRPGRLAVRDRSVGQARWPRRSRRRPARGASTRS